MDHAILYCFRNRVKEFENEIKEIAEAKETTLSISPTYCMKLCMFCEGQHVVIINKEVIIEKSKEQFIKKVIEKIS